MSSILRARPPQRHVRGPAAGEILLTATLLSLYVGCHGTARVLGAIEAVVTR
jgi:hypothetical protein